MHVNKHIPYLFAVVNCSHRYYKCRYRLNIRQYLISVARLNMLGQLSVERLYMLGQLSVDRLYMLGQLSVDRLYMLGQLSVARLYIAGSALC